MPIAEPTDELRRLRRRLIQLEKHFLTQHISGATLAAPSEAEVLDVEAYVILSHAALEAFIEELASWMLERSVELWTMKSRLRRGAASLLLYCVDEKPDAGKHRGFDRLRIALKAAKGKLSKVINENNGIDAKHLAALFGPLGLDLPDDPALLASWHRVISMRHWSAHHNRLGAAVLSTAGDVRDNVRDCLTLATNLQRQARKSC